jgi:hypothetical protein
VTSCLRAFPDSNASTRLQSLPVVVLSQAFGDELDLWIAAENGMFLRHSSSKRDWINVMPEHMNMDWMESVQVRITPVRVVGLIRPLGSGLANKKLDPSGCGMRRGLGGQCRLASFFGFPKF